MSSKRYQVYRGNIPKSTQETTLESNKYESRMSTIFSTDVKGYSKLMGDNASHTVETITKYRTIISSIIDNNRGRVIDSPGDNLLAEFSDANDALIAAEKIQTELKKENKSLPKKRRMVFRIGINHGAIIEDGGRLYGDGVNIAARLEGLADGGGVCISESVYKLLHETLSFQYTYLGKKSVKNISQTVKVYKVNFESDKQTIITKLNLTHYLVGILVFIALFYAGHIKYIFGALNNYSFYFLNPIEYLIDELWMTLAAALILIIIFSLIIFKFYSHEKVVRLIKSVYVVGWLVTLSLILTNFISNYVDVLDNVVYESANNFYKHNGNDADIFSEKSESSTAAATIKDSQIFLTKSEIDLSDKWFPLKTKSDAIGFLQNNQVITGQFQSNFYSYIIKLGDVIALNLGLVLFGIGFRLKWI